MDSKIEKAPAVGVFDVFRLQTLKRLSAEWGGEGEKSCSWYDIHTKWHFVALALDSITRTPEQERPCGDTDDISSPTSRSFPPTRLTQKQTQIKITAFFFFFKKLAHTPPLHVILVKWLKKKTHCKECLKYTSMIFCNLRGIYIYSENCSLMSRWINLLGTLDGINKQSTVYVYA